LAFVDKRPVDAIVVVYVLIFFCARVLFEPVDLFVYKIQLKKIFSAERTESDFKTVFVIRLSL